MPPSGAGVGLVPKSMKPGIEWGELTAADVLVVDTIGFVPGMIASPTKHSSRLHVIERYSLNPETLELRRDFVAEDPVYFTDQYVGYDVVLPADVPWVPHACGR